MRVAGPAGHLSRLFTSAVQRAYPALPAERFPPAFQRSALPLSQAHYQLNVAFPIAKHLQLKPRDVAERIVAQAPRDDSVASIDISGSGFVNVRVRPAWLAAQFPTAAHVPRTLQPSRVTIDYGSPNMAKELHVGHLRTVVIGDALARLLEARGHAVTRVSHVGDFGTPLAQTLEMLREAGLRPLNLAPAELSRAYASAKKRAATDAAFVARAHALLAAMQRPEPSEARRLWEEVCAASRAGYSAVFRTLGVSPLLRERGEASYAPQLPGLVAELQARGVAVASEGAVVVPAPEGVDGVAPLVVQKRDGTFGYATTDLAALRARVAEGAEWLLYVVDRSQGAHLRAVFHAARAAGYLPPAVRATHLPFGVVKGENNFKLASRDGTPPSLDFLLREAVAECTRALATTRALMAAEVEAAPGEEPRRQGGAAAELSTDAEALGVAAVKYFELAQHPLSDYVFSLQRVMALRGNTALYLNYAAARIAALRRRAALVPAPAFEGEAVEGAEEEALALKIAQFGEALEAAEAELAPSHVCTYLHELAQRFHAFYDACKVVGHPRQAPRLALAAATDAVLTQAYALLGLRAAQRI